MTVAYITCDCCHKPIAEGREIDIRIRDIHAGKRCRSQRRIDICDACYAVILSQCRAQPGEADG